MRRQAERMSNGVGAVGGGVRLGGKREGLMTLVVALQSAADVARARAHADDGDGTIYSRGGW